MKNSSRENFLRKEKERKEERYNARKEAYKISQIKEYQVHSNCLLLDFLIANVKDKSRNNLKTLLKNKLIAVDGTTTTQFDFELFKGDVVQISKTPLSAVKNKSRNGIVKSIIYEDNEIIVINKPSGLLAIATDKEKSKTAYHLLTEYVKEKDVHNRVFVVHRIDKDTSGVLMVAKNDVLKNKLQDNWNHLVKTRKYIAICDGVFEKKEGSIRQFLKETKTNIMYNSHVEGDGKEALTHYKVLKQGKRFALVEVYIDSGRKNQIRVAMQSLGHPIVGDNKYGNGVDPLKRLGLHAEVLEIKHPYTGKLMSFVAPLPVEFNKII